MYFYPRSPCGERRCLIMLGGFAVDFYPRSPCGERLWVLRKVPILSIFLSTLSLRRATYQDKFSIPSDNISIHALLAESDTPTLESLTPTQTFLSTLSLRRATYPCSGKMWSCGFLSTLSLRRATGVSIRCVALVMNFYPRSPCGERRESQPPCERPTTYFYPRSPCGERLSCYVNPVPVNYISIHALLAESDQSRGSVSMSRYLFLSTLSLRRATKYRRIPRRHSAFLSTLSLRRATCMSEDVSYSIIVFLSTLSLRRATICSGNSVAGNFQFLSTLSLRRATRNVIDSNCNFSHFYPRSPCGERPSSVNVSASGSTFLSTLSLRRATSAKSTPAEVKRYFYPRSPCGERRRTGQSV